MEFIGRLLGFSGRIGRGAFWLMILPWVLILIAMRFTLWASTSVPKPTGFPALVYETVSKTTIGIMEGDPPLVLTLFVIVAFLLFLSACVRRLHDLGKSVLLILVLFWPAVFLLLKYALSIFGFDVSYAPIFWSLIGVGALLVLWQLELFIELGFRRSRRPAEAPEQAAPAQVTPQIAQRAHGDTSRLVQRIGWPFGLRGRIGRGAFWALSAPWLLFLAATLAWVISAVAGKPIIPEATLEGIGGSPLTSWLLLFALFLMLLLFVSATVRRLHDLGRSGLLVLVFFLPTIILVSAAAIGVDARWVQKPIVSFGLLALWLWGLVLLFEMAFRRGRQPPEEFGHSTSQGISPQRA